MLPTRWDQILEQKPVPVLEHLLEELSKLFAGDLEKWPPPIDDFDPATGATTAALLRDSPLRPDARLYREAFKLSRFDLSRQLDAQADYVRNQRWLEAGLAAKDRAMLLFLSRFMVEQVLALGEATHGRVDRAGMLEVLARTERRVCGVAS